MLLFSCFSLTVISPVLAHHPTFQCRILLRKSKYCMHKHLCVCGSLPSLYVFPMYSWGECFPGSLFFFWQIFFPLISVCGEYVWQIHDTFFPLYTHNNLLSESKPPADLDANLFLVAFFPSFCPPILMIFCFWSKYLSLISLYHPQ